MKPYISLFETNTNKATKKINNATKIQTKQKTIRFAVDENTIDENLLLKNGMTRLQIDEYINYAKLHNQFKELAAVANQKVKDAEKAFGGKDKLDDIKKQFSLVINKLNEADHGSILLDENILVTITKKKKPATVDQVLDKLLETTMKKYNIDLTKLIAKIKKDLEGSTTAMDVAILGKPDLIKESILQEGFLNRLEDFIITMWHNIKLFFKDLFSQKLKIEETINKIWN